LIVASVIPLAMLFAISLMNIFGVSGNLMSLGALDFGLIVDGAVIIVESTLHFIYHHGNNRLNQKQLDDQVYQSASKFSKSAVFGQIIILVVYLPLLVLIGIEGKMFKPMAQTVMFAILGALILSLTYVPMISSVFLSKKIVVIETISDKIIKAIRSIYTPALNFLLKKQRTVVASIVGLLVISSLIFSNLGAEFIPSLDEGDFAVEMRLLTGSSLTATVEATENASEIILKNFPEVEQVVGKIGTAEIPTDPMPMEACDLMIILKDKDEWTSASNKEELAEKMQMMLEDNLPGVSFGFQQPIQMRFNELMTGAKQDVVVKVYGEDLDKLSEYAGKIGGLCSKINGVQDVYVEQMTGLPQMIVSYDRDALSRFGIDIEDVNRSLNISFAGQSAGLIFEGEKRFDLVVKLDPTSRANIDDLRSITVTSPTGVQVPLDQLANVQYEKGPNQIQRDDAQRRIIVGFNLNNLFVERD
jgi:cobalt-zinc-cadmium resistance protein CzcA